MTTPRRSTMPIAGNRTIIFNLVEDLRLELNAWIDRETRFLGTAPDLINVLMGAHNFYKLCVQKAVIDARDAEVDGPGRIAIYKMMLETTTDAFNELIRLERDHELSKLNVEEHRGRHDIDSDRVDRGPEHTES